MWVGWKRAKMDARSKTVSILPPLNKNIRWQRLEYHGKARRCIVWQCRSQRQRQIVRRKPDLEDQGKKRSTARENLAMLMQTPTLPCRTPRNGVRRLEYLPLL